MLKPRGHQGSRRAHGQSAGKVKLPEKSRPTKEDMLARIKANLSRTNPDRGTP